MTVTPQHGVCLDGIITIICHTESDCKSNNDVCEGSRCQSLCDTDDDCAVGQSCVLSICTSNCSVSTFYMNSNCYRFDYEPYSVLIRNAVTDTP